MAMNGNTLGTAVKDALIAAELAKPGVDLEAVWQTIAAAIVAHIQSNAVVTVSAGQTVATPDTINGTTTSPGTGTIA